MKKKITDPVPMNQQPRWGGQGRKGTFTSDVIVPKNVKITVSPPIKDRYAPDGPVTGFSTEDPRLVHLRASRWTEFAAR